jgi:hypothetical protein
MAEEPHPTRARGEEPVEKLTLQYASPGTPRPEIAGRLVIGLLIAFLALAAVFFGIVIYMSRME